MWVRALLLCKKQHAELWLRFYGWRYLGDMVKHFLSRPRRFENIDIMDSTIALTTQGIEPKYLVNESVSRAVAGLFLLVAVWIRRFLETTVRFFCTSFSTTLQIWTPVFEAPPTLCIAIDWNGLKNPRKISLFPYQAHNWSSRPWALFIIVKTAKVHFIC